MGIYENDVFKIGKAKTDRILEILSKYDIGVEDVNEITKAFADVYYDLYESNASAKVLEKIAKETSSLGSEELYAIYTKFMAKEIGFSSPESGLKKDEEIIDAAMSSSSLKPETIDDFSDNDLTEENELLVREKRLLNSDYFSIEEDEEPDSDFQNSISETVNQEPEDKEPESEDWVYGNIENQYLAESRQEYEKASSEANYFNLEDRYLGEEEPEKQEIKRADRLSPKSGKLGFSKLGFGRQSQDSLPVVSGEVFQ